MLYEKEKLIEDIDKWAFDIEQSYENGGIITPKKKRQHFKLIALRDKKYDEYLEEIKHYNSLGGTRRLPSPKFCGERMTYMANKYRAGGDSIVWRNV